MSNRQTRLSASVRAAAYVPSRATWLRSLLPADRDCPTSVSAPRQLASINLSKVPVDIARRTGKFRHIERFRGVVVASAGENLRPAAGCCLVSCCSSAECQEGRFADFHALTAYPSCLTPCAALHVRADVGEAWSSSENRHRGIMRVGGHVALPSGLVVRLCRAALIRT